MKIVFNTYYPEAAASVFYLAGLSKLKDNITINDKSNYTNYDIGLFMTYPKDLEDLKITKQKFPNLKIGLIDPRNSDIVKYIKYIDFFIVDSIEMYDFFCRFGKPIYTYYEYPDIKEEIKIHTDKSPIIIAYHGNKVHLSAMHNTVSKAISDLRKKYDIEFWAIYNIKKLGKANFGLPGNTPVKHIQWNENVYNDVLKDADIGIVPALMPLYRKKRIKRKASVFKKFFGETDEDYLIRFKMPSNPGRIIVFAKLGIPVVADFLPSSMQFIKHLQNGMLAYSAGGWYDALEKLIIDKQVRQNLSNNMKKTVEKINFEKQNTELLIFLEKSILTDTIKPAVPLFENTDNSYYLRKNAMFAYYKTKWYYLKKKLKNK